MAGEAAIAGTPTGTAKLRDQLLKQLAELERTVRADVEETTSFHKLNAAFDAQNETTQLLLAACEKLANAKSAMDQANFEEHTSELAYLIRHYGTTLGEGLSDKAHREKLASTRKEDDSWKHGNEQPGKRCFSSLCCQAEFPPQQKWWTDIRSRLVSQPQVLRAGKLVTSVPSEVVPGDVIFLCAGQKAVADGRVLVHTEGSVVDVAHVTQRPKDLRIVSTRNTAAASIDSANIVLKDSYMVCGAVFCAVVKSPRDPFVPPSVYSNTVTVDSGQGFQVNTTLPQGMSMSSAQSMFKALCTKAQLAPKSFSMISRLARVRTLIVPLTEEVLSKGTVPKFCTIAGRLGKAVVLVNCNCPRGAVGSLCHELGAECFDFGDFGDTAEPFECLPPEQPATADPRFEQMNSTVGIPVGGLFAQPWGCASEAAVDAETKRIADLTGQLENKKGPVALNGISQAGLLSLCRALHSTERPLLYAISGFHYPRCFRDLVFGYDQMCVDNHQGLQIPPCTTDGSVSSARGGGSPLPQAPRNTLNVHGRLSQGDARKMPGGSPGSQAPPNSNRATAVSVQSTDSSQFNLKDMMPPASRDQRGSISSVSSTIEEASDKFHVNPDKMKPRNSEASFDHLAVKQGAEARALAEVLVSVNSIGVVSEYADCVLLREDLGCLGQALEIVNRS